VQAVASDLTGVRGEEAEFGKLTIRRHPALNGTAKVLDIKPDEIEGLEPMVTFCDAPDFLVVIRAQTLASET
jgi:hypothetical protein